MLKKLSLVFGSKVITAFGTILFVLVLNHYYDTATTGLYMTFISICLGLSLFCKFGSELYLVKNCSIALSEGNDALFWHVIFNIVLFVFVNTLIIIFIACLVIIISNDLHLIQLTKYLVVVLPLLNFLAIGSAILRAVNKAEFSLFFQIGSITFVTSLLIILFSYYSFDIEQESVLECMLYSCIFLIIILLLFVYRVCPKINILIVKSFVCDLTFMKTLPNFFIPTFIHYFIQWGCLIVLSFYVSNYNVGLFSTAQRFSYLINFILIVVNMVTAPKFAILFKQQKIKEIESLCIKLSNYMSLLLLAIIPLTILIVPLFVKELNLYDGYVVFIILIIGQIINVITGTVEILLNMTGHEKEMRNIMLKSFFITALFFIILTPFFGVFGAAISVSLGLSLQNSLASWKVYNVLKIKTLPKILHKVIYSA
jgi:O-antigen/teichoic acid export membrane protein